MTSSTVDTLTQINLDDLISSFGWQNRPFLARLLRHTLIYPPLTFAHQMAEFDAAIASHGLVEASRSAMRNYTDDLRIFGQDRIPSSAFLALSTLFSTSCLEPSMVVSFESNSFCISLTTMSWRRALSSNSSLCFFWESSRV